VPKISEFINLFSNTIQPGNMNKISIGVLTPSSNTALEPLIAAMLANLPDVSAHFARFKVTEISLNSQALGQFDEGNIIAAARLLADARVNVIVWCGTSSGWLGFDKDQALCDSIQRETGTAACTSVLALNEAIALGQHRSLGLVTPYLDKVQQAIIKNYGSNGVACVAERHLDKHVNFEFAQVTESEIRSMVAHVALAKPDCITTFCTNLHAAQLVSELEATLGIPVYDTVSTGVWKALRMCGVDTRRVQGWGRLFQEA
jgi:maleate isomerase